MKNPYEKKVRNRTIILLFFFLIWLAAIVLRLIQLQVIDYTRLKNEVAEQNHDVEKIIPKRGTLFDRSGNILARSLPRASVFYIPSKDEPMQKHLEKIQALRKSLHLSSTKTAGIIERLKKSDSFIWIKRKIEPEEAARLKALDLAGVHFDEENKRFYPQGRLAVHVIGRVNIDDRGQSGIEYRYNGFLEGQKGERLILKDAKYREYRFETLKAPVPGKNLILTIDETIQYIAEKELEKVARKTQARWGTVIISHPPSGDILAMANYPAYDLNFPPPDVAKIDRNKAIHQTFDPGSTFKIITASAALETKSVSLNAVFDCSQGAITVPGKVIRDHKKMGVLTFPEVIIHSSNVGTVQIGQKIGEKNLYETIKAFGFGQRTGIDLPAEEQGIFRPIESWTDISLSSLSIGYEISVTAIQMLQAINIVAQKGSVIPPRIVKNAPNQEGADIDTPHQGQRVLSEETALQMSRMLEGVVLSGTGTQAQIEGYRVAGKTGTAQKFDPAIGRYSARLHTSSFVGYVPVEDPILSIIVIIDEPKGVFYGGEVAAPLFRETALQTLRYLQIPRQHIPPQRMIASQQKQ
ncbi:MAG: penicillin-binding protein 2 [Candidatus Aminicenantes bacterium]|nr:penicillin-binding protein 2 [Candidatus Aminicenantes bacterium]